MSGQRFRRIVARSKGMAWPPRGGTKIDPPPTPGPATIRGYNPEGQPIQERVELIGPGPFVTRQVFYSVRAPEWHFAPAPQVEVKP